MPTGIGEEVKEYLTTETVDVKAVSDYTSLNFDECLQLDIYTYRLLLKDAFIHDMKQTQEGREYLEDCWLLQQTTPNRGKLKERFGGEKDA